MLSRVVLALFLAPTIASTFICSDAHAAHKSFTAQRAPGETFQQALSRNRALLLEGKNPSNWYTFSKSAAEEKVPFAQTPVDQVPEWTAANQIEDVFMKIRDERFLSDRQHPDFLRRLSWIYPDDGCFARADFMARLLEQWGHPKPAKIFVFGDLNVQTDNSPAGQVTWWYHVVVGYRVGQQVIVFDPAIDAAKPLTLEQWAGRMTDRLDSIEISICDTSSYQAMGSSCKGGFPPNEEMVTSEQRTFLSYEWDRVEELGLDPEKVLGDLPPWKNPLELPILGYRETLRSGSIERSFSRIGSIR